MLFYIFLEIKIEQLLTILTIVFFNFITIRVHTKSFSVIKFLQ